MNAQLLWTEAAVYEAHAAIELWVDENGMCELDSSEFTRHHPKHRLAASRHIQDGGLIRL